MFRASFSLTTLLLLASVAWAQEVPKARPAAIREAPQPPKYNPNDPKSIIDFIIADARSLRRERDLVTRRLRQYELERLLAGLPGDVRELQDGIASATREVRNAREGLYILTTALPVLIQKARDNPDDFYAVYYLGQKLYDELSPQLFITDPEAAAKKLAAIKAVLGEVEQKATTDVTKQQLARAQKSVAAFEENIALSKDAQVKQQALVGTEAPPLIVDEWLNGTPLSAGDLKGQLVMFVIFSASSFSSAAADDEDWPAHLKQLSAWQTKYAERGLVVIGVTGYSNVRWDEAQQTPVRIRREKEVVPPEEERAMLAKLARAQGWTQRLAILKRDEYLKTIMHYPALSQQTVVIDRQGKIRFVRGGTCEQFTREIREMLETLLSSADR